VGSCPEWLLMQNEILHEELARTFVGQQADRIHAAVALFLETHQKDLQRRYRLCRKHPGAAWWPGDVHDNNLNRLGQARRR
jgi:hypothetical protein